MRAGIENTKNRLIEISKGIKRKFDKGRKTINLTKTIDKIRGNRYNIQYRGQD